ncbi:MAG: hypothetical protein U1E59_03330 [Amaricoccus sp.]
MPLAAQALTYSFSFTNPFAVDNGVSGQVLGQVDGLADNATGRASSVQIFVGSPATGEYVSASDRLPNSFTVANGAITAFNFRSSGLFNTAPAVTCCAFNMYTNAQGQIYAGLSASARG